jgi:zinc-binding alcohol dehydrogenase/oxidoreductase
LYVLARVATVGISWKPSPSPPRGPGRRAFSRQIDSIGKETWGQALAALRPGGRLVSFGATTGRITDVDIRTVFWNQLGILGTTMGSPRDFATMLGASEAGRLKPMVDSVFPLREAAAAHQRMDEGTQFGKIVLVP